MSDRTLRLAIVGMGRMGRAIAALAPDRGFEVVAELGTARTAAGITREMLGGADVAIEFTAPDAAARNIRQLLDAGCPTVVGTTGWYAVLDEITAHANARRASLFYAPNFSIGVAIFAQLAAEAGRLLAQLPGFDAHLVETHHVAKKDAPSGTALMLRAAAGEALRRPIPITAVRTGSVPGTHELIFDAPFETIRLEHVARDRRVFAEGALVAARWLQGRVGVFGMRDLLAARDGS